MARISTLFCLLLMLCCVDELKSEPQYKVLYINSYHPGFAWSDEVTEGILSYFDERDSFLVMTEYMDAKRQPPEKVEEWFWPYLNSKYSESPLDLLITSDNSALDFVLKHRSDALFAGVPIVFGGISNPDDYPVEAADLYGVIETDMFVASFDILKRLYPDFRTIYLFADKTNTGLVYRANAERLIEKQPGYKLVVVDSLYYNGIDTLMDGITGNSMVYYHGISVDGGGNLVDHFAIARRVFAQAKVPVFSSYIVDIEGAIGGMYVGGFEHGELCGLIAEKRLKGQRIENRINVAPMSGIYDYARLVQYNLDPNLVPQGVKVLNQPETIWVKYKSLVIINVLFVGLLIMAVFVLIWSNKTQARAKRLMEKAMEKALESDNLKGAFLANVSHELRTPLNAICGFSELMKVELNDPELENYVDVIYKNSELLALLVNDLLDISLIDANAVKINVAPVDLESLFLLFEQQAVSVLKVKNKENLSITMCTNPLYRNVQTDSFRVSQVMLNMISNAVKYTEAGGITIGYNHVGEVKEWLPQNPPGDAYLVLYVKDTGIGIDRDKQHMVFERFRSVDSKFMSQHGGVGLGLNISKSMVDLLGGEIFVSSERGKGTIFGFFLPL